MLVQCRCESEREQCVGSGSARAVVVVQCGKKRQSVTGRKAQKRHEEHKCQSMLFFKGYVFLDERKRE